jgi:hypothetical protein
MWYFSPSEDQNETVLPNGIAAAVESDRNTIVREDVKSSEPHRSARTLAYSQAEHSLGRPRQ